MMQASRSCRCLARSTPPCRTAPSRRRRRANRKVVLATSIAENLADHRGRPHCRRLRPGAGAALEPDIGLTRLETVRASRAAVDQRRGRAGRTEPGVCYRLWDEPQTASLAAYTQPEILLADLSSLVLDLAQWGVRDPHALAFLDSPAGARAEGSRTACSRELGALDADGRITAEGQSLRALALPPRLARMIVDSHRLGAGEEAAEIAAILTERGLGGDSVDLDHRLDQFRRDRSPRASSARSLAQRWAQQVGEEKGPPAALRVSRRPPASCWHLPFPTASRATAAMAASCSPMAVAPPLNRLRRWRAHPMSRSPN